MEDTNNGTNYLPTRDSLIQALDEASDRLWTACSQRPASDRKALTKSALAIEKAMKRLEETQIEAFTVGQGATWNGYSDAYAGTVIKVSKSGRRIWVQEDTATLLNGFNSGEADALQFTPGGFCGHTSGRQRYDYAPNPNGRVVEFSVRKNGRWVQKGCNARSGMTVWGGRSKHHDYNF